MFARFIGFGVGHKSQYQSEKVHDGLGDPEDENDPASEDLPDETESVISLGEEIEENDGDEDSDAGDIGEDVEDQSEDDIDETPEDGATGSDESMDFEF